MDPVWKAWLDKIKEGWGISNDLIEIKLQRLLQATGNHPTAEQLATFIRGYVNLQSIDIALLRSVQEIRDLVAEGGKSVPKRNRSALA